MTSASKIPASFLRRSRVVCFGLLLVLALCSASAATAQGYKVEKTTLAPPPELTPAVWETLSGEALRVTGPNGPLCEIWLRKVVPARSQAAKELGILYAQLAEGTLVGAVRFPGEVKDYRRQRVRPGVYTLRYALLPVDGNHQGVSPNRDFLLISLAAADASPAAIPRDNLLNLSRKASGTSHPSVWSLAPVEEETNSLPAMTYLKNDGLWLLMFHVEQQAGNAPAASMRMALVVVGSAPEA